MCDAVIIHPLKKRGKWIIVSRLHACHGKNGFVRERKESEMEGGVGFVSSETVLVARFAE